MTMLGDPRLDFAVLCDAVQAAQGKLFILGGGWNVLNVTRFPARHHSLGIGIRLLIPWTRADEEFELTIDLMDEDGGSVFQEQQMVHRFTATRSGDTPEGAELSVIRAFTFNNVPLALAAVKVRAG